MTKEEWIVVPREPTEAMIEAHFLTHASSQTVFAGVPELWAAMLKAAPRPTAMKGSPAMVRAAEALILEFENIYDVDDGRGSIPGDLMALVDRLKAELPAIEERMYEEAAEGGMIEPH